MIRHADLATAGRAFERWGGAPATLRLLGISGSAVWRGTGPGGADLVLRLVDPAHRDRSQVESELAFVRHLADRGARVAVPVAAPEGPFVHEVDGFVASVVTWAGEESAPDRAGTPAFDRAWGAALAELHEAALDYAGPERWEWSAERWLADADRLLPADDAEARRTWSGLRERLAALPRTREEYGTIHGDHGPQNFRYDAAAGTVTTFDFGNACRHWFAMDVTVALSTLRRDPHRARRCADVLAGYAGVRGPVPLLREAWADLLRLRFLYVYLSRLDVFGPAPDAGQRATLAMLRELAVHGASFSLPEEPA